MKNLFRITALILITSWTLQAQTEIETLYSKSYETNANTTALLEFKGSSVEIYKSEDDKFHIEYTVEFTNYPNRKKKTVREKVNIESNLVNNQIMLVDKSKFSMYRFYQFKTISSSLYLRNQSAVTSYSYKSEDAFLNEIIEATKPTPFYIRYIQSSDYSEEEKKKSINRYNNRKHRKYAQKIKIKVPINLSLTINAKASTIRIQDNLENQISLRADGGKVYTNNLRNSDNVIKLKDAPLIANSINGGELILDNSKRTIIGELKNVKLNSEFSELEIGQIDTNVEITDFTSKYIIYNFSNDFEILNMNTEYSEINMFFPKNKDFYIETFGFDTVHHFKDGLSTEVEPAISNKPVKMLVVGKETNPNKIKINTIHGIVRFGEDFIDIGE